jgi:hypothetical protein
MIEGDELRVAGPKGHRNIAQALAWVNESLIAIAL